MSVTLVPSVSGGLPALRYGDTVPAPSDVSVESAVTARPDDLARYAVTFGSFRLLAGQHLLLESGQPVRLGSRALDILIALIERRGETVTNEELMNNRVRSTSNRGAPPRWRGGALLQLRRSGDPTLRKLWAVRRGFP